MNERKLTEEQIDNLYDYCKDNMVPYYDIQVELVDHLASAIEKYWETTPDFPFEKALHTISDGFGGRQGFVKIKEIKKKALNKTYQRLLWKYVGEFYKFPKLMITICIAMCLYVGLGFSENDQWLIVSIVVTLIGFSIFYLFYYYPKHLKPKLPKEKKFWLSTVSERFLVKVPMFASSFLVTIVKGEYHFSTFAAVVFSIIVSFYLVILWCDCFYIPKRILEHIGMQFPQFVKA